MATSKFHIRTPTLNAVLGLGSTFGSRLRRQASSLTKDLGHSLPLQLLHKISVELSVDTPSHLLQHASVKLHAAHNQPRIRSLSVAFGKAYQELDPLKLHAPSSCCRTSTLRYLASQFGIDPSKVRNAIRLLEKAGEHGGRDTVPPLAAFTRIQTSCISTYETVFRLLLQDNAVHGMKCLMEMREDLLRWIDCLASIDSEQAQLLNQLKQMDAHLLNHISMWMVPGLLQMRRLTYQDTSASILERIVRNEAVHPVSNLDDLRKRLGAGRRVFGLFHPCLPEEPLFVLYVSLQDKIPSSMPQIHGIDQDNVVERPTVAAFYSISSLRPGLAGIGLGEYMIQCAVKELQDTLPSVETFCTLSPLPTFRAWLTERVNHTSTDVSRSANFPAPPEDTLASLVAISGGCVDTPTDVLKTALEGLSANETQSISNEPMLGALRPWLMKCAAHYLVKEKHRKQPLDRVARFHVGNGAIMDRIHWNADLSRKGWKNSFGIMATYRYDLNNLSRNQEAYQTNDCEIPVGSSVQDFL